MALDRRESRSCGFGTGDTAGVLRKSFIFAEGIAQAPGETSPGPDLNPVAHYNPAGVPRARLLALLRGKGLRMGRSRRNRSRHCSHAGLYFVFGENLELAREVSALFDCDSAGPNVPLDYRTLSHIGALPGLNIAIHRATDRHVLCCNIGSDTAIGANRQAVSAQLDTAFHLAVYVDILAAGELSMNENRPAKVGEVLGTSHIDGPLHLREFQPN